MTLAPVEKRAVVAVAGLIALAAVVCGQWALRPPVWYDEGITLLILAGNPVPH
ncbi:MAG: hypothetical protein AAFT19_07405 [Pseudomonadota bacterium]